VSPRQQQHCLIAAAPRHTRATVARLRTSGAMWHTLTFTYARCTDTRQRSSAVLPGQQAGAAVAPPLLGCTINNACLYVSSADMSSVTWSTLRSCVRRAPGAGCCCPAVPHWWQWRSCCCSSALIIRSGAFLNPDVVHVHLLRPLNRACSGIAEQHQDAWQQAPLIPVVLHAASPAACCYEQRSCHDSFVSCGRVVCEGWQ
jgi:hypothetical protein